ncbi:hypothetical protein GCM10010168_35620 [Actinoplanes ianthinogenes]|uniref:Uncharacterized protein n=1 Tax=Actinoplanes ianthinogenes TaxID=122358 RepID=A0ABM7M5Q8_9ACTN|nr:hypothetical protein [Actinoplanes ianthinogenes]BCJ46918.1 hypothetical protein Aiant_75750 [Actinoplanes ianthinogenes]GGR14646.1 hypothetical protein GCM10010168_35620 [Actinoplanes ianthinogenes]
MAADIDAATTIVALMATDAWRQARSLLAGVWRRNRPDQAGCLEVELDSAERIVAVARRGGAGPTEGAVRGDWRRRIDEFLTANPGARDDLRETLRQMAALPRQESRRGTLVYSRGQYFGRHYQSAGDLVIND